MKPRHKYQPSGFDDEINEEEDEKMENLMTGADRTRLTDETWCFFTMKISVVCGLAMKHGGLTVQPVQKP